MSAEDVTGSSTGPGQAPGQPSEEELRAAYEAELSRISVTDMMAQAAVSLLNLGARRLAPDGEGGGDPVHSQRDLGQARDAIDGVKALLDILERTIASELGPLRDALSRLQMAYAREMQAGGSPAPATSPQSAGAGEQPPAAQPPAAQPGASRQQPPEPGEQPPGPGPAESSGRLWVPGR